MLITTGGGSADPTLAYATEKDLNDAIVRRQNETSVDSSRVYSSGTEAEPGKPVILCKNLQAPSDPAAATDTGHDGNTCTTPVCPK